MYRFLSYFFSSFFLLLCFLFFFFFNDTATTEIYTLSLHDALPILSPTTAALCVSEPLPPYAPVSMNFLADRKSTRLNSSHLGISYAVFCLKKKKKKKSTKTIQQTLKNNNTKLNNKSDAAKQTTKTD